MREMRVGHYVSGGTFIVAARTSAQVGAIVTTTDSGNTWTTLRTFTTGEARFLTDIQFLDNTTGFTVGYNGLTPVGGTGSFAKTTDGGATWTVVTIAGTSALQAVNFVDANNGMVVGQNGSGFGMVAETTNGGTTWNVIPVNQANFLYSCRSFGRKMWFGGDRRTVSDGMFLRKNKLF